MVKYVIEGFDKKTEWLAFQHPITVEHLKLFGYEEDDMDACYPVTVNEVRQVAPNAPDTLDYFVSAYADEPETNSVSG